MTTYNFKKIMVVPPAKVGQKTLEIRLNSRFASSPSCFVYISEEFHNLTSLI